MSDVVDLSCQSVPVDGCEWVRKSPLTFPGSEDGGFLTHLDDDCRTMYDAIRRGARLSEDGPCLGWHDRAGDPYSWISYSACIQRARNLAAGLIATGLSTGQNTNVGIYAPNCVEWVLVEQGCYCFNMVLVPLYDTLGRDACSFIMQQTQMSTVVVNSSDKVTTLLEIGSDMLSHIVVIKEDVLPPLIQLAKDRGVKLSTFREIEALGANTELEDTPPEPSDMTSICYTSGTTGSPKGVITTHENMVSVISSNIQHLGASAVVPTDKYISFLPLAHSFERGMQGCILWSGGSIGFFRGEIAALMDDLRDLTPTIMPAVPRLLERIYDTVWSKVSGSYIKSCLLRWALSSKDAQFRQYAVSNNSFWDWLVLGKIRDIFGGQIRLLITGSAPTSSEIRTFIRCVLGCTVLEGYGLTETMGACSGTNVGDWETGHVGVPLPCCHIKLVDVPDMEYSAKSGKGEVCIRGSSVFTGYYKDPEKTKEAFDDGGWFRSGDIGEWLPSGCLRIIDRRKDTFKLSQGEYISPARLESVYTRSKYITQAFVYGESLKSCLIAVVVPDEVVLKSWASGFGIKVDNFEDLCKMSDVKKMVMEDMAQQAKVAQLKGFEKIKDVFLHWEMFSVENDLLTPTMKPKRLALRQFFKDQLSEMYSGLS